MVSRNASIRLLSIKLWKPSLLSVSGWEIQSDHIQPVTDLTRKSWEWGVLMWIPQAFIKCLLPPGILQELLSQETGLCLALSFCLLYLTMRQICKQMFATTYRNTPTSHATLRKLFFVNTLFQRVGGGFLIKGGWSLSTVGMSYPRCFRFPETVTLEGAILLEEAILDCFSVAVTLAKRNWGGKGFIWLRCLIPVHHWRKSGQGPWSKAAFWQVLSLVCPVLSPLSLSLLLK